MRARLLLLPLALTGCVVVGGEVPVGPDAPAPASPPPSGASAGAEAVERAVFDRVNAERAARDLPPVQWSDQLAQVARSWSREMADAGEISHQDLRSVLQGEDLQGLSSLGENVFGATGPVTAGRIHVGWMQSPGHRGNVVDPGWDRLGVGVHCAEDGSTWATQQFGRTQGADLPPVQDEVPPEEPLARPEPDGPTC